MTEVQANNVACADSWMEHCGMPTYTDLLSLLIECQPTLDHDACMARGTPAEKIRANLAERVRAATEAAA